MRLTYILLVASAALVGTLDTSVVTGSTVANTGISSSAFALESHGQRSLRLRKDDYVDNEEEESDDDDEQKEESDVDDDQEERMWGVSSLAKAKKALEDKMALTAVASNFLGKSADEMGEVIKKLTPAQIETIFDTGEDSIKKILPGFTTGMEFNKFDDLIKGLPQEQQAVMMSAYSKYLINKGLL